MQDHTSEIRPLQPIYTEEIIINCCQHQQFQEHYSEKRHPFVQPTVSNLSISAPKTKLINRSQSTKDIEFLQQNQLQQTWQLLKHQQSLPTANTFNINDDIKHTLNNANNANHSKSVSILVYKTLNNVFKSSRKIVVRVCEVASIKRNFNMFKFNKGGSQNRSDACTGHDQFVRPPIPEKKVKHIMKKLHKQHGMKRSNSAIDFDVSAIAAANRRPLQNSERTMSTDHDNSDHSEHSEKSPLVSARPNVKCQYLALDSDTGIIDHSPREKSQRESALNAAQKWIQCFRDRYEIIAHLDKIGSRQGKNWFLVTDATVRTDRLLTLLALPPDCIAFQSLSSSDQSDSLKNVLKELLGSLHHPYIYPVLDLGFTQATYGNYACLVTPFNSKGSLKDLIYKVQWNEPWSRKYTHKPKGLPFTQVQRLGRQILEALLFLKKRGFPMHGHLHSGNVILQNGAARLSGLENGLLGLCSRNNAVMWSRAAADIDNIDIICFGHLLYEMCMGQELTTPKPSMNVLRIDMEQYPQIYNVLDLIFQPPNGILPTIEDLVLCDIFRSIDLRELQGPCFTTIQPNLSRSTLNLLHEVKKRQCASLDRSISEANSPLTPPATPNYNTNRNHFHGLPMAGQRNYNSQCHRRCIPKILWNHSYPQLTEKSHYDFEYPTQYYDKNAHTMEESVINLENVYDSQHKQYQFQKNNQLTYNDKVILDGCCSPSFLSKVIAHPSPTEELATLHNSYCSSEGSTAVGTTTAATMVLHDEVENINRTQQLKQPNLVNEITDKENIQPKEHQTVLDINAPSSSHTSALIISMANLNNQLTAQMCNYKNSKSRRLEYSLKYLKYGRSNPSQDSAFGSLTDNDLSNGSTSIRLNSFQSTSSPIDESVEHIKPTITAGHDICLELSVLPRSMVSQDSAISSPCRESLPSSFLNMEEGSSFGVSCSSTSTGHARHQYLTKSLSPKILVTNTINSNLGLDSYTETEACNQQSKNDHSHQEEMQQQQSKQQIRNQAQSHTQQFDPPTILVNDQNSIYTTLPAKCLGNIEVFSQKYHVNSFEDVCANNIDTSTDKHRLKHVNRLAFRSLEDEQRIDNAFIPITDRTHSDNRVNMQSEKYKKLTHSSFRISKPSNPSNQIVLCDTSLPSKVTKSQNSSIMLTDYTKPSERPTTTTGSSNTRQIMWRDSKFYHKTRIAKSNDSLLEISSNHSLRLSPVSLQDNPCCSSLSCSQSRQSLNHGSSANEISISSHALGAELLLTTSFCNNPLTNDRRYCSSKSEDLCETVDNLCFMNERKAYSERQLVTLTTLKQTAINDICALESSDGSCMSEDDKSFKKATCKAYPEVKQRHQKSLRPSTTQPQNSQELTQMQSDLKQYQVIQHQQRKHRHNQSKSTRSKQINDQTHYTRYKCQHKRPRGNHFSWSTCSINRLKSTNVKTTSLATLPFKSNSISPSPSLCNLNASRAISASKHAAQLRFFQPKKNAVLWTTQLKESSRNAIESHFHKHKANLGKIESTTDTTSSDNSLNSNLTLSEETSSPDESPSKRTLNDIELTKIFKLNSTSSGSSCCNEEKTPLLDNAEICTISPAVSISEDCNLKMNELT